MKRAALALVLLTLVVAAPASAQRESTTLFPREAIVEVERSGLVRLPVPPDVLRTAQPDFSDVRILGPQGNEWPYIVEAATHAASERGRLHAIAVTPVDVERSGSAPADAPETSVERFEVLVPGPLAPGARFRLLLDADAASFVRRVVVTRLTGDERTELAQATVFRLANPTRERSVVELPALPTGSRLSIEISGEGRYLEPRISFLTTTLPLVPTMIDLPLRELSRTSEDGVTVITLARPRGVRADRLRFETAQSHFTRSVTASEPMGDELGRGVLFRVPELDLESMEFDLGPSGGDTLELRVDDGDSPALEDLRAIAVVRAPNLVFASGEGTQRLLYGGHRVRAPRYDLQQAAFPLRARLHDVALPVVVAGEPHDNPDYAAGPALEFAMRPGRAVDVARFSHVAPLRVAGATEGSSRVPIAPPLAAVARSDLRDLRIVDAEGRQWPYLVRRATETSRLEVTAEVEESDGETTYRIAVPDGNGHVSALELFTELDYVSRNYHLVGFDEDGRPHSLQSGDLYRDPVAGARLLLEFDATWLARLELTVVDGSEAPLRFDRVELEMTTSELFLAAPDGDYRILLGDPEASAPSYEIERARDLVLEASAVDATVGAVVANPAHVEPPWHASAELSSWIVWGVLLFAVLVLGVLTFRLAGRDGGSGDGGGGDSGGGDAPAGDEGATPGGGEAEDDAPEAPVDEPPVGDEDSAKAPRPLSF